MIIYKYLNPESTLATVKSGSVLLRTPEEYNDPFDSVFYISKKEMKRSYNLLVNYECFKDLYSKLIVENEKPKKLIFYANILKGNINIVAPRIIKKKRYTYQRDIAAYYRFAKVALGKNDEQLRQQFESTVKSVMKQVRHNILVSCFSLSCDSILMWSHYAKNHTGACIEFEVNNDSFKGVGYHKKPYAFKLSRVLEYVFGNEFSGLKSDYNDESLLFMAEPIFNKSVMWKNEKEIRCVFSNTTRDKNIYEDNGYILFKMPPIKKIIVGCKADEIFIKHLKEISNTPVSKMKMVDGEYKVIEE